MASRSRTDPGPHPGEKDTADPQPERLGSILPCPSLWSLRAPSPLQRSQPLYNKHVNIHKPENYLAIHYSL